jgi:hypothetical protein
MVQFLASMLRSLRVAMMAEKQKIIFLLDSGAHFSVLPFSPGPQSNDKSYHLGHIWHAPRALFYLTLWPALGETSSSVTLLILPETPVSLLGWDLLSQLKAQILLPPGTYSCCSLLQEQRRFHSVE